MADEPKRRVTGSNELLTLNKCIKAIDELEEKQRLWVLKTLTALYTGELPDGTAKG